ncbi:hypothetical protein NA57DRAFT_57333 [Rhizodiscina lignyota]|uniref:GPI anchored serine-threonine rich protein n=1 Tax=Rhizodiscina lignyota TaxID=1504668 RepID=A0A9P4IEG7_9PEZI|nr:hypothetical protein NA57DRAFT_57333 [Rhizodiscina lignyota]
MQFTTILTLAGVAAVASATVYDAAPFALVKRQGGDSFIPGSVVVGDTCPSGQLPCGTQWCTIPSRGDVCCKEGYACPGGSFCLTQGYCCPDGDDPKECARANGVSLPPDFNTSPLPPSSAAASSSSASSSVVATTPSSAPVVSSTPSSAPAPVVSSTPSSSAPPFPTSSSTTPKVLPTGTGAGSFTQPPTSLFTGAANAHAEIGGGLAFVLAVFGYLV